MINIIKKVKSIELLTEIKNLNNKEALYIDNFYKINSDNLQNFIIVFLEHLEKNIKLKEVTVKYISDINITVNFNIDFYDIYTSCINDIVVSDVLKFNCYNVKDVFIFDNYLCVVMKDKSKLYFN